MTLASRLTPIKNRFVHTRQRFTTMTGRYPFITFLVFLGVLVGLVVLGSYLRQPVVTAETSLTQPVLVSTYKVGGVPTITLQAKVEKSGLIKVVAQTSGVVQKIKLTEGQTVSKGGSIMYLSTTYQGANAPAVSRKMSQVSYQFLVDNNQAQVDSLNRSKEIANRGETQASQMREINRQAINDTKSLITLNETILNSLDAQIKENEDTNVAGSNDDAILQLQQAKSGILSALSNLRSGLRTSEYLNNNDKDPAKIDILVRDNTLQQLELQQKSLDLNKNIAQLTLRLAQINESFMYPASPIAGTVERIHVKAGQLVNPGTVLATIRGNKNNATAVALVGQQLAQSVSHIDPSQVVLNGQTLDIMPRSISQEPTEGSLHSIVYSLPENLGSTLTNDSYIEIKVPVGPANFQTMGSPYVPLDAIYQSQTGASLNIVDQTQSPPVAKSISITLGSVTGQYVEVTQGLNQGDIIILNRNVVAGDPVQLQ